MAHVLFVVWEDPLISIGQNTFIADALRWAGAESIIVANQNWPQVSMEEVLRLQPDYIVLTSDHLAAETHGHVNNLRDRPTWRELRAVELGHVVMASDQFTRPSPGLVDAIEALARELHPEAFGASAAEVTTTFSQWTVGAGLRPAPLCANAGMLPQFAAARLSGEASACAR